MLTDQDIQDLKDYTADYNEFCKNQTCDSNCFIFQRSQTSGKSCWQEYCLFRKTQKSN